MRRASSSPLPASRQPPANYSDYPCSEYFAQFSRGVFDPNAQLWHIYPASEVAERPNLDFLAVGTAGVDGIEFGFRKGQSGVWAHYPLEAEFRLVAPNLEDLDTGWRSGRITV